MGSTKILNESDKVPLQRNFKTIMSDEAYDEVICIGRVEKRAIFLDEEDELAYKYDPDKMYEVGENSISYGNLIPFNSLDEVTRMKILKNL